MVGGSESTDTPAEILVVDDVPENLVAVEAALSDLGCKLVLASSGEEALRYLLDRDFALILLDVQMPNLDGIDTAKLIRSRQRSKHVPIIFVTAYGRNDDDVLAAYRLGAVDFLFKPVSSEVLRAKASVFVELQRRTAEVAQQAEKIKEHEKSLRLTALADQKMSLEARAMRERLREQEHHASELEEQIAKTEEARRELSLLNQQLTEADHRKDEFIAILAHELRNPLAALVSGLTLVTGSDESANSKPAISGPEVLAAMERQCSYLSHLVDDLLDVSRLSSGKMQIQREYIRAQSVVDDAITLATPEIERRNHSLSQDIDAGDAILYGDPVRLSQIVVNLLVNAARYTPPEGKIAIRSERRGDMFSIYVSDNGRGMSEELVSRVFELFVQEESQTEGLGIGLTLVRDLAELHGGKVEAQSAGPGRGSTFSLQMPLADPSSIPADSTKAVETRESIPRRIVLIDDHEDLRELTAVLLTQWGHEVEIAATGGEGAELICATKPNVAIVDIGLPDIMGYEVAERVRKELGDESPYLIALSGYAQKRDRERSQEAGFDLHLSKPVKSEELRKALESLPQREENK